MSSKFEELMRGLGKVQQLPIDAPLMPLSKQQSKKADENKDIKSDEDVPKPAWSKRVDPGPGAILNELEKAIASKGEAK